MPPRHWSASRSTKTSSARPASRPPTDDDVSLWPLVSRPEHPHAKRLLHAAGQFLPAITPAPEEVAAYRTDDGAAGVLGEHQSLQGTACRGCARRGLGAVDPHRSA